MRRSNKERSDSMRMALIEAARELFVEKGYAETATPEIVAAAGVTRGALYHHFEDKKALFRAVIEHEAGKVAEEIEAASPTGDGTARETLALGAGAYFDAMTERGRTRLLLLDGPAVLGAEMIRMIDAAHAGESLMAGLSGLFVASEKMPDRLDILANLLSAAFDRAALAIEAGGSRKDYEKAIFALIDGLAVR